MAGRITRYVPLGVVLVGGPLLIGVADLLIPLARGPAVLAVGLPCAAQFLFGVGLPLYRVNEVSLRQMIVPERFLGRVNSGEYFVREGLVPIGALLGGLLGEVIGLRPTLVIGALGEGGALIWVLFSPARSLQRHPDSSTEGCDSAAHEAQASYQVRVIGNASAPGSASSATRGFPLARE